MNGLGVLLIWCAIQVSLVTLFVACLFFVLRRVGLAVGSFAPLLALLTIVALPVFVFLPGPSWFDVANSTSDESTFRETDATTLPTDDRLVIANSAETDPSTSQSSFSMFAQSFLDELSVARPNVSPESSDLRWTGLFALVLIVGAAIGVLHLIAGVLWMRVYRRRGSVVDDPAMMGLLDKLRDELNCRWRVELRESLALSTAATIGWLRPIILLPPEWTEWSPQERRSVLAHELAHICRHDYLACVCGQLSLAIHFYHPFVHWLVGQLRLEQELAADDLAASSSGGRQTYLTTLAELALRQSDRRMTWAASAFLPTRSTFMRRIAMLRQDRAGDKSSTRSKLSRVIVIAAMAVLAFVVTGLRSPNSLLGQQTPAETEAKRADKEEKTVRKKQARFKAAAQSDLSLAYVPRDAAIVFAVRPSALLKRPELKGMAAAIEEGEEINEQIGISIDRVERFTMLFLTQADDEPMPVFGGYIIRTAQPADAKSFASKIAPDAAKNSYDGQDYFKNDANGASYFFADPRTVVVCEREEHLRRLIIAGETGASKTTWANVWKQVAKHDAAVQYNFMLIRDAINAEMTGRARPRTSTQAFYSQFVLFSPIWNKADSLAVGMKLDGRLTLSAIADSKSADDVNEVKPTLEAAATLGRNLLSMARRAASKESGPTGATWLKSADIADSLLDKLKISTRGDDVVAETTADREDSQKLISTLIPAITAARIAARRAQSMNNMRQIGLAFHNYYDVNKTLPKSKNGEGRHPHSWRVAILPYLEQQKLYDQYRFDEPWDSEHNKTLLDKMPDIFRHPNPGSATTHASYYVLTGENTIFDNNLLFSDIRDGTSKTILVVESKRSVPWTKPDDIPYDAEKPLPKLGGFFDEGFNATFADGSVRFISKHIEEKVLRAFFTADGGERDRDTLRGR